MSPVIECINVCKHYPQGNEGLVVLDQVSFQVNSAETIAIIGSSGAGKSTLLNLLGGLDQPTKGQVKINGALLKGQSETAFARDGVNQQYSLVQSALVEKRTVDN